MDHTILKALNAIQEIRSAQRGLIVSLAPTTDRESKLQPIYIDSVDFEAYTDLKLSAMEAWLAFEILKPFIKDATLDLLARDLSDKFLLEI
ncbi:MULTISPECIES: hypothetical protein [Campylobacter]|uniref:hypothetical protein n=1 Tax=Campylobacter TaxID=194 RepID=UPI0014700E61|nr:MULTISPECIES: hypothetical protein [Campylobacter]MBN7287560.1 hypothetical protein [Campylobacter curvus]MDU6826573.1 hypothetical protein [Campylobacter sp.]